MCVCVCVCYKLARSVEAGLFHLPCVKGYVEAGVLSLFAEAGDRPRHVKEA